MKPKQGLGRALGVHHGSVGLSIRSRSSGQCELPNSGLKRVTLVFESRRFHGLRRDARCGTADAFVKTVQIGGQVPPGAQRLTLHHPNLRNEGARSNDMKICTGFRLLLLLSLFVPLVLPQAIMEPTDHPVSLDGVLRIVHGFGAPGYGEDKKVDARISYWALDLPFKVNIACTPSRPDFADIECGATSRLRLFFPVSPSDNDLESKAKRLRGHKATVTGVLHRRVSMYQITPVYMDIADIAAAPSHAGSSTQR